MFQVTLPTMCTVVVVMNVGCWRQMDTAELEVTLHLATDSAFCSLPDPPPQSLPLSPRRELVNPRIRLLSQLVTVHNQ